MKKNQILEKALLFVAIFFAVVIIVSNAIGFFWLNSLFIGAVSLVISFFLVKKFGPKIETERGLFALMLFLLVLLIFPLILINNFFPASIDPISTSMLRILDGRIPLTHEPYSTINLSYALGSPLVNNMFSETITIIPDYLWPWIMGVVSGVLQLFFFYLFAGALFTNKKTAIYATAIFFCGKLIFENFYVGEMAWYLGSMFMFLFLYLHLKKNPLQYIVFPAVFAAHPLAGFNLLVILCVYWATHLPKVKEVLKLAISLLLVAPLIVMSYGPIAVNLLFNRGTGMSFLPPGFLPAVAAMPFWVGTGLTIVLIFAIVLALKKKMLSKFEEKKFLAGLLIFSAALFIFFCSIGFMLAGKEIEVTIIAMVLLSAALFAQMKFENKKRLAVIAIILIVAMVFFFASTKLDHYRDGSKISQDGITFARGFYEIDPEMSTVLFLTKEGGKIAEYSNKIPYDVTGSHTIVYFAFVYYHDAAYDELGVKKEIQESIFAGKEIGKIQDLNVKYIAVNTADFNTPLPYKLIYNYNSYNLYEK